MTKDEFFNEALLRIAGNGAFGNDWREDKRKWSFKDWAIDIRKAAHALTDIAVECRTLEGQPDKPP